LVERFLTDEDMKINIGMHRRVLEVPAHLVQKARDLAMRPLQNVHKRAERDGLEAVVDDVVRQKADEFLDIIPGPGPDGHLLHRVSDVDEAGVAEAFRVPLRGVHVRVGEPQGLGEVVHHAGGCIVRRHRAVVAAIYPAELVELDPAARFERPVHTGWKDTQDGETLTLLGPNADPRPDVEYPLRVLQRGVVQLDAAEEHHGVVLHELAALLGGVVGEVVAALAEAVEAAAVLVDVVGDAGR
ncbi:hypothetical protein CI238_08106, partial [Colletotrichum incanum]